MKHLHFFPTIHSNVTLVITHLTFETLSLPDASRFLFSSRIQKIESSVCSSPSPKGPKYSNNLTSHVGGFFFFFCLFPNAPRWPFGLTLVRELLRKLFHKWLSNSTSSWFTFIHSWNKGVCHTMALPFTLKSILRKKKKNYGNSNISQCKNIIFPPQKKKSFKRNQNLSKCHNSVTNLKFQHKPKYHLSKILI